MRRDTARESERATHTGGKRGKEGERDRKGERDIHIYIYMPETPPGGYLFRLQDVESRGREET